MRSQILACVAVALGFGLGMMVEAMRASAADNDKGHVTGIGGVFFKAQNPQTLAAWYRDHLGIGLVAAGKSPNSPSFCAFDWIEKDGGKPGSTAFAIFSDKSDYFSPSNASFMINFRVTNLDALLAQLKQEGATVASKVETESNGRFSWAIDPEGNKIELWEPSGK